MLLIQFVNLYKRMLNILFLCFHISSDHIIHHISLILTQMRPTLKHLFLTPFQVMVDEPFPIRNLAADNPILIVFKHSRLRIFHRYVVVYKTLRIFQQFKTMHCRVSNCNGLCMYKHNRSKLPIMLLSQFVKLLERNYNIQ